VHLRRRLRLAPRVAAFYTVDNILSKDNPQL
jgi:hypothetical protein